MYRELMMDAVHIGQDCISYQEFRRRWNRHFDEAGLTWISRIIAEQAQQLAFEPKPGKQQELEKMVSELIFGFGVSLLELASPTPITPLYPSAS